MKRLVLLAAALAIPTEASACPAVIPTCDSLSNPIFLQVGDTQLNLMKALGRKLRDNSGNPLTLVFSTSGSCTNIDNFYNHTAPITTNFQFIPSIAEDPTWVQSSPTCACTPRAGGVLPDIGNSALFIASCTTATPPATVHFTNGPIQAYVMAVPKASSQTAITYEEAYFVFGFGMAGMVTPWVDESQMFIRTITKSTLLTWAANISVPGAKWKGVRYDGSPMVVSALQTSPSPETALGILGAEVYDANRASLSILAFRSSQQYAAYYPDSTSTSHDKQNIRDGHYTVWSPTVWMDNIDANMQPTNANARYVVDMIAGHDVTPPPSFDPSEIVARVGLVPDCAMRVQRSFDGGPLSLYRPPASCTCRFLSVTDANQCQTCPAGTCSTGVCRAGFCEDF
jgi:hypothetical protein